MEKEIININGIRGFIDANGTAFLNLDDVARGLGFTDNSKGAEYIRWNTVRQYLKDIGFSQLPAKDDYIPENVFYRLAMKAKNEAAEAFQAKVADEVLPTIRRHGAYMTPAKIEEVLADPDTIIQLATQLKKERAERQALQLQAEKDRPKVIFADAVTASKTSILVGELAKLLKQNGVEIGQNRFFIWLRERGYLISRKGTDYNMPTQRSMEMGLFEIKETSVTHSDGHITVSKTPKVTGKGQIYFINKLKERP